MCITSTKSRSTRGGSYEPASWVAVQLPVTRVCPVCLVEERCYSEVIYLLLGGGELGKVGG